MKSTFVFLTPPTTEEKSNWRYFKELGIPNMKDLKSMCDIIGKDTVDVSTTLRFIAATRESHGKDAYKLISYEIWGRTFYFIIQEEKLKSYVNALSEIAKGNNHIEKTGLENITSDNPEIPEGWIDVTKNVLFFSNKEMAEKINNWLHYE